MIVSLPEGPPFPRAHLAARHTQLLFPNEVAVPLYAAL